MATLALALIQAVQGDKAAALRSVQSSNADPASKSFMADIASMAADVLDFDRLLTESPIEDMILVGRLTLIISEASNVIAPGDQRDPGKTVAQLSVPKMPACVADSNEFMKFMRAGWRRDVAGVSAQLGGIAERLPNAAVLVLRAEGLAEVGDLDHALETARRACQAPPFMKIGRTAWCQRGVLAAMLWQRRDDFAANSPYGREAYESFVTALRQGPFLRTGGLTKLETQLGISTLLRKRDYRTARDAIAATWPPNASDATAQDYLGTIDFLEGNFGNAILHAQNTLKLQPNHPHAKLLLEKSQRLFDARVVGPPDDTAGVFDFGPATSARSASIRPATQP
jgi:tetratricopeptide (TPR) repeat protein